jgi:hypothetical protein
MAAFGVEEADAATPKAGRVPLSFATSGGDVDNLDDLQD